ncbi:MAG: HAD-IA family hydrolase [Actinomycetia bacterium]|nr:HAD-IA family hydrolase [Actinomycetes bacterium]
MRSLSAVIFDMDGLMFDTERLGWRLLNQAGVEFGCNPISMERYTQAIGKTHTETRKIFSEMCDHDYALYNAVEARFWALDREYIRRAGPPTKPGLRDLLQSLKERGVPCALASSTRTERVEEHLNAAEITSYFQVVVGGEQAPASKPDPGIFLLAAEQLGQPAQRCLVLEDSCAGVRAGRSAGMYVIMVPDIVQPTPEIRAKADLVLESLTDVERLIVTGRLSFSPT